MHAQQRNDPEYRFRRNKQAARSQGLAMLTPEGRVRHLIRIANIRARYNGIPCGTVLADLLPLPKMCPVLGLTLNYSGTRDHSGVVKDACASIDRISPEKGYVRGNVRILSWRANTLRKNGTAAELMAVALDAAKLKEQGGP